MIKLHHKFSFSSLEYPTSSSFFSTSCLLSKSRESPRSFRSFHTYRGSSFSTTMWMIYRVHCFTSYSWSFSHPSCTTCFPKCYLIIVRVRNLSESCITFFMYESDFSRRHFYLCVLSFLRNYGSSRTS